MSNKILAYIVASLAVVLAIGFIFTMAGGSNEESRESLSGRWTADASALVQFEAVIEGSQIRIDVTLDGARDLYWMGDLDINGVVEDGDTLHSQGNQEILSSSMFGSLSPEKVFTYSNGDLVFYFGIQGTTHEIHLEEQ